jgi:hypothetical protein
LRSTIVLPFQGDVRIGLCTQGGALSAWGGRRCALGWFVPTPSGFRGDPGVNGESKTACMGEGVVDDSLFQFSGTTWAQSLKGE